MEVTRTIGIANYSLFHNSEKFWRAEILRLGRANKQNWIKFISNEPTHFIGFGQGTFSFSFREIKEKKGTTERRDWQVKQRGDRKKDETFGSREREGGKYQGVALKVVPSYFSHSHYLGNETEQRIKRGIWFELLFTKYLLHCPQLQALKMQISISQQRGFN